MTYTIGTPYALEIDDYAIPVYSDGHDVAYIYLNGSDDMKIHFYTRDFVPMDATRETMAEMGMHRPDILQELQELNGVATPAAYVSPAPMASEVAEDIVVHRAGEGNTLWNVPEKTAGYVVGGRIPELVFPWDTEDTLIGELVSDHFRAHRTAVTLADCVGWWRYEGDFYVDVNDHVNDLRNARGLGMARGQISIWDIANAKEIFL